MSTKLFSMKIVSFSVSLTACMAIMILISITDISFAQSTNERLTAIEKQLNAIQRQVFTPGSRFQSGGSSSNDQSNSAITVDSGGGLIADVSIRISELENQIRQMTGQLEEANFKVDTLTRKLETLEKDYEFRLADLEKGTGGPSNNSLVLPDTSMPSAAVNTPAPVTGSPKQQYDYAYGLVSKGQYAEAEVSLVQFLEAHPEDELAGNAQYWLGQTYYARGNYTDATRTFLEGMSKYPESSKAPAFLLKVGMALTNLGETQEACEVYRELDSRFPESTENTRMRAAEERKAGCS